MTLPWKEGSTPLMLAPMQGLTNRGMRNVMASLAKPDVLFTEFVRVKPRSKDLISKVDLVEACARSGDVPLVVQVIGSAEEGVIEAAQTLVDRGVEHINVNMGCPFGRMTSVLAGGGMFKYPETIEPMLAELREIVPGSLSVKTRAGIEDPRGIVELIEVFENTGLDFLIIHPRTVKQKYKGQADHELTRELVELASFPVIANGDVRTVEDGRRVMSETGSIGLMVGRGLVNDPLLFQRLRGNAPWKSGQRRKELTVFFAALVEQYKSIFHGDQQVLAKFKSVLSQIEPGDDAKWLKLLKKQKKLGGLESALR